ncbi:MAG: hypothetical protein BJ554DRAFT_460 [Olpidium bornovanus]|uniref:SKP1 component dimerisation domain-containing protein n=1 Tax=Olpidium bornovanus TaxID=278681 RepID=A0A8H8DI57_9FUNG|nr:MAG: hypothetical protein BJ554DRAFT_460 [Olpidium bornovanus]
MLATAAVNNESAAQAVADTDRSPESIHIKTRDGSSFTVPLSLLRDSETIQAWLAEQTEKSDKRDDAKPKGTPAAADVDTVPVFEVPHVTPYILKKALQFQLDYADAGEYEEKNFKYEDVKDEYKELSNEDLLQLTMAADILQMARLTRACAEVMAKRMEGKSPEEMKAMFDIDGLQEIDDEKAGEDELEDAKMQIAEEAETDNATAA